MSALPDSLDVDQAAELGLLSRIEVFLDGALVDRVTRYDITAGEIEQIQVDESGLMMLTDDGEVQRVIRRGKS